MTSRRVNVRNPHTDPDRPPITNYWALRRTDGRLVDISSHPDGAQRYAKPGDELVALPLGEPSCGWTTGWEQGCPVKAPCEFHAQLSCVTCGRQSTHACPFAGQFVCGEPLCAGHKMCTRHGGASGPPMQEATSMADIATAYSEGRKVWIEDA